MSTQTLALIFGIAYLAAGVMGMIPMFLVPPPVDAPPTTFTILYGYFLGLFPVNLLHNLVHMVVGIWGLAATTGAASARTYARSLAIFYGLLAVLGVIPGLNTMFGLIPIHGHDVWLHAGTAAIAAYFGWRSETSHERRSTLERRRVLQPIARERRSAIDRRRGYGGMHPA
jgi:hypothetical protein